MIIVLYFTPHREAPSTLRHTATDAQRCGKPRPVDTSSSSATAIAADLLRLIPPYEHTAFREMLQSELRGQGVRDHAQRR
jgi:hypothetical protein